MKKISTRKRYIDKLLGELTCGGYNKKKLRVDNFLPFVTLAISRAEELDIDPNLNYPTDVGSHVYKLVKQLIRYH